MLKATRNAVATALIVGGTLLTVLAGPAQAQCPGDCNGNGMVSPGENQKVISIILLCPCTTGIGGEAAGCAAIPGTDKQCTSADRSTPGGGQVPNGCISAGELQAIISNVINFETGCPPGAVPTSTPTTPAAVSTSTPTNTPINTVTFTLPPGDTATPTNTPANTATPTNTPIDTATFTLPPANTATPTNTPTSTPTATQGGSTTPPIGIHSISLLPGRPLCRGMCVGGSAPGRRCEFDGGSSGCGGGTCQNKVCYGGAMPGTTCVSSFACGAANGCASTPLTGSCAVVQGKIVTPRLPLLGSLMFDIGAPDANGVAIVKIPAASTQLDAQVVSGIGFACVTQGADAMGIIDCDGGSMNIDQLLEIDHNTSPSGVCMRGSNAGGACTMDSQCPGVSTTGACNLFNSGPANGLPDDATCTRTIMLPDGSSSIACPEGERVCVGGVNVGRPCLNDPDCPSSTCSATKCGSGPNVGMACTEDVECPQSRCASYICRGGSNNGNVCDANDDCPSGVCIPCSGNDTATNHTGVCRSPTRFTQSGTFAPGAMLIPVPLAIQLLDTDGSQNGPDALPCTADDTPDAPPAPVTVVLGTGKATLKVYDANNLNNDQIAPGALCSGLPCVAELTGGAFSCATLATSVTAGGRIVGGFPAADTLAGDIATVFQFESQ